MRPFTALVLAANTPSSGHNLYLPVADPLPEPSPLLHLTRTSGRVVGTVTTARWYHHLLVVHGHTSLNPGTIGSPIPVHFSLECQAPTVLPHPADAHARVHSGWRLESLTVGEHLGDSSDPHGRLCVSLLSDPGASVYDQAHRYHPLRVSSWGNQHGAVKLHTSAPLPTVEEEDLLATYAHYRVHLASTGPVPSPALLANPRAAEPDPLVVRRDGKGHWHYARTSWGGHSVTSRPGRSLAELLEVVEEGDGTVQHWRAYERTRRAPHG